MDWTAFTLSLRLAAWTTLLLLPLGIVAGRTLAARRFPGKSWVEALVALPLVLPPTVLGFYLLVPIVPNGPLGQFTPWLGLGTPPFTFRGL